MSRITGRVEVYVNGEMLLNKTGTILRGIGISGEPAFEVTPVFGDGGLHGYTETPKPAECEVKVTDRDDQNLSTIARIRENGTIIVRAARGGKVYTMDRATCANNMEITTGEGETSIKFIGPYWVESTEAAT